MGYSGCLDSNNAEQRLAVEQKYNAGFRARDDGRFLQSNYGNGVLNTWWGSGTMSAHVQGTDVASVDKYAYTSPHVQGLIPNSDDWPEGADPARSATYGWLQDQMEGFRDPDDMNPLWVFVETAKPYLTESGATTIKPAQVKGAVWAAIRHGALGIAYFQHNNNGQFGTYSLVDGPESLKASVSDLNASVQALAPVINTQTLEWDAGAGTDTMLKVHDGSMYLFAGVGLGQEPGRQTLKLPVDVAEVLVVGEGRTVPVSGGSFTDGFASEFTSHSYRATL